MREILFRAKCVHSGEWEYGNFIHSKRFEGCSNEFRIHNQTIGLEIDIVPETVCQFTGLTDRNGVKIFEGDIVTFTRYIGDWRSCDGSHKQITTKHLIQWDNKVSRFGLSSPSSDTQKFREHTAYIYEVIGNIHDNPELL